MQQTTHGIARPFNSVGTRGADQTRLAHTERGSTGLYPSTVFDLIRRNGDPAPAVRRTDGIRR